MCIAVINYFSNLPSCHKAKLQFQSSRMRTSTRCPSSRVASICARCIAAVPPVIAARWSGRFSLPGNGLGIVQSCGGLCARVEDGEGFVSRPNVRGRTPGPHDSSRVVLLASPYFLPREKGFRSSGASLFHCCN